MTGIKIVCPQIMMPQNFLACAQLYMRTMQCEGLPESQFDENFNQSQNFSSLTCAGIGWNIVQWKLNLRKPDLRKNLDLRKIVATTDFLVHKLFDFLKERLSKA